MHIQTAVKYGSDLFSFNVGPRQLSGSIMVCRTLGEWITLYIQSIPLHTEVGICNCMCIIMTLYCIQSKTLIDKKRLTSYVK